MENQKTQAKVRTWIKQLSESETEAEKEKAVDIVAACVKFLDTTNVAQNIKAKQTEKYAAERERVEGEVEGLLEEKRR